MKKAILINSLNAGGAEKVITVLLQEFQHKGHEVELILLEENSFHPLCEGVKITLLSSSKGSENNFFKLLALPLLALKLKKYVKKNKIALVQSHLYRANYVNLLARWLRSDHTCQVVNANQPSLYLKSGLAGKINLFLIKHLYPCADLIILKAGGMLEDMRQLFAFRNRQCVINNPYQLQTIITMGKEKVLKSEFDFSAEKKYLISVSRLVEHKKFADLINAFKKISKKYPLLELIIIGNGKERQRLENLRNRLQLTGRIHFLGTRSNPFKFITSADIFISASSSEGFPNVLVEAMICKIPVISTDCVSGPREILAPDSDYKKRLQKGIEKAACGILVPVGANEELSGAIDLILSDQKLGQKFVDRAFARAKDFSVEQIADRYLEVMTNC